MPETTAEHFKIFQEEAQKWIDKLGMFGWDVDYRHGEAVLGGLAECGYSTADMASAMVLASDWGQVDPTEHKVRMSAKHEVLELFLGKYCDLAESRCVTQNELDQARHEIIRTLERVLT